MRYKIIRQPNGYYGVLDIIRNEMVVSDESMGVCDSIIYAHTHPFTISEGGEVLESYEKEAIS